MGTLSNAYWPAYSVRGRSCCAYMGACGCSSESPTLTGLSIVGVSVDTQTLTAPFRLSQNRPATQRHGRLVDVLLPLTTRQQREDQPEEDQLQASFSALPALKVGK